MRRTIIATAALAVLAGTGTVRAQERWAFEIRGGAGMTTQDFGDADLGTGFGFEGTVRYRIQPHLALYAGWDWYHYSTDESFAGADVDIEDTGYAFGFRFEHPLGTSPAALWARAGGIYDHAEIEDSDGEIVADSGHGLGWEIGGGLALPIARAWKVTPGVRYRMLSRDIDIGDARTEIDLSYAALELGFSRVF